MKKEKGVALKQARDELQKKLAIAVEKNRHTEIKTLLKKGADPNLPSRGMPILISISPQTGDAAVKTLKILLAAGSKPDAKVEFGTALGMACRFNNDKLVEAYL